MGICESVKKETETKSISVADKGINRGARTNPNSISVKVVNESKRQFYVRVEAKNDGDEEFILLENGAEHEWNRTIGNSYCVQFVNRPEPQSGPVYFIRCGEIIYIQPNLDVFHNDGEYASVSWEHFDRENKEPINEDRKLNPEMIKFMKENYLKEEEDDKNGVPRKLKAGQQERIYILNATFNNDIYIRIKKESRNGNGNEDFFPIPELEYETWLREIGSYLIEVKNPPKLSSSSNLAATTQLYRFYVSTGVIYQFELNGKLKNIMSDNYVPSTNTQFCNTTVEDHDEDDDADIYNNVVIPKMDEVSKKAVIIKNISGDTIIIIVKSTSSGCGSQDPSELENNCQCSWTRSPGKYLVVINEKKFYCNTGISYVYIQNNLTDEKTGNLAESPEEIKDTTHVIVDTLDSNLPSSQYLNGIVPKVIGDHFIDIQFPPEARIINALDGNGRKVPG